jgi:hypothetical protein
MTTATAGSGRTQFSYASQRSSRLERNDSTASSVGSWNSISRNNSGMISRSDSLNSNGATGINLLALPRAERKLVKSVIFVSVSLL